MIRVSRVIRVIRVIKVIKVSRMSRASRVSMVNRVIRMSRVIRVIRLISVIGSVTSSNLSTMKCWAYKSAFRPESPWAVCENAVIVGCEANTIGLLFVGSFLRFAKNTSIEGPVGKLRVPQSRTSHAPTCWLAMKPCALAPNRRHPIQKSLPASHFGCTPHIPARCRSS